MALSIVPLARPMYNVYRLYEDAYRRWDDGVFLKELFDNSVGSSEGSGDSAPPNVVKSMADNYVANLMAIYNIRVAMLRKRNSEKAIAGMYLGLAIVILTAGVAYGVYEMMKKIKQGGGGGEDGEYEKKTGIVFLVAIVIAYAFLMALVIMTYVRKVRSLNNIYNTDFDTTGLGQLDDVFGEFLTKPVLSDDMIKYETSANDSGQYINLLQWCMKHEYIKRERRVVKGDDGKSVKDTVYVFTGTGSNAKMARGIVLAYALWKRNANIEGANAGEALFPGFGFGVPIQNVLLRQIQQLDLIGQVNRLSDSIAYIKGLLAKTGRGGEGVKGGSVTYRIVERVKDLFKGRELLTMSMIPVGAFRREDVLEGTKTAASCSQVCSANKECAFSIFDGGSGKCAIVNKKIVGNYPMFYTVDGATKNTRFNTFVKDGEEIYLAHPTSGDPVLKQRMFSMMTNDGAGSSLESLGACTYSSESGLCVGKDVYRVNGDGLDVKGWFMDSTAEKVVASTDLNPFTVRAATGNVLDSELKKGFGASLERLKETYTEQIARIVQSEDPSGAFVFDAASVAAISEVAGAQYPQYNVEMRNMVVDILNAVPARLAAMRNADGEVSDPRDVKYVSGDQLVEKLRAMTPYEFAGNFMTHVYTVYATSNGLNSLNKFYDNTVQDINLSTTLLTLLSVFVLLEGILVVVWFFIKKKWDESIAEFGKEMKDGMEYIVGETNQGVRKTVRKVGNSIQNNLENLGEFGKEMKDGMEYIVGETKESVGKTVRKVGNSIQNNLEELGKVVDNTKTLAEKFSNLANRRIQEDIGDLRKTLFNIVGKPVNAIINNDKIRTLVYYTDDIKKHFNSSSSEDEKKIVFKLLDSIVNAGYDILSSSTIDERISEINKFIGNATKHINSILNQDTKSKAYKKKDYITKTFQTFQQLLMSRNYKNIEQGVFLDALVNLIVSIRHVYVDVKKSPGGSLDMSVFGILSFGGGTIQKGGSSENTTKSITNTLDTAIQLTVMIAVILIVVVLLMVSSQRRQSIGMFNYDTMNRNADIMTQSSKTVLGYLYEDVKNGKIHESSEGLRALDVSIYSIDVLKSNLALFANEGKTRIGDIDARFYRDQLADMVESYDKCNALLFGANVTIPFPTYEVSVYVILLAVVLAAIIALSLHMRPGEGIKRLKYLRTVVNNYNKNKIVDRNELLEVLGKMADDGPNGGDAQTAKIVKITALGLIPFATLLFVTQLLRSTSDLGGALYGSNLYRSNLCYNL